MLDQPDQALFQSAPEFEPEALGRTKRFFASHVELKISSNDTKTVFFAK
jgi:hypothetical protein